MSGTLKANATTIHRSMVNPPWFRVLAAGRTMRARVRASQWEDHRGDVETVSALGRKRTFADVRYRPNANTRVDAESTRRHAKAGHGGVSRYESLDYTSSTSQHRLRHYNAERLRGALVDDEFECARLLDGQVPWIRSPEDLLNVDGRMS